MAAPLVPAEPDSERSLPSGSAGWWRFAVPGPVRGDGEVVDGATVALASVSDSSPSVRLLALVAGFVFLLRHFS
jgi:hypothetical protein